MKNNIDFIYEYSDLNVLQTRVEVLKGKYANTIFEYGGSGVMTGAGTPTFSFDYQLYVCPNGEPSNKFLTNLLVSVIAARNSDADEKSKSEEAASAYGVQNSRIKIPESFYKSSITVV
jgi:hypothetical protein